jgi:alpha-1,6-mannosyltransferase
MPELIARTFGEYARRAAARYVKRLYRRFDAVFAPSAYVASRLADLGIENVIVQPLGVDTRLFEPGRRDPGWRTLHQLSPRARVLLYVGRYASEKNLEVLSAAVRRLGPPYVLVTIGGGPTPPSGPRVIALPYESNPLQLARAYASADVFVHAGDQETFGLAALEALASGLPVVGCAQGGVAEIIDGPFGMAVARCQADHFAEAIDTIDRRSQDTDIASAARARAIEYEWQTVLARLDHHYARLVGAARSGYAPLEQRAA